MRTSLLLALAVILIESPTWASDRPVPASALAAVGLSGLEQISDARGHDVRGMHNGATARGRSLVTGLLLDPESDSFVFGSDANTASTIADYGFAFEIQASAIEITLVVEPTENFSGIQSTLIGGAGGSAFASR